MDDHGGKRQGKSLYTLDNLQGDNDYYRGVFCKVPRTNMPCICQGGTEMGTDGHSLGSCYNVSKSLGEERT
eukprot:scaffold50704_cov22-Cyclotella_meneghiniana.AAC.2